MGLVCIGRKCLIVQSYLETITIEIVRLMNELNLDVNTEDVNEIIANEYLIDQPEYENEIQNESE